MNDFLLGKLETYCYMVKRGKPAAVLPVQKRYTEETRDFVNNQDLNVLTKELNEDWDELWIYKYPHMKRVIKKLPQEPETITDHWMLGKLFGYDEQSIQEFLEE